MGDEVKAQWKIELDHPIQPVSRWGHGRPAHPQLTQIVAAGRNRYRAVLESCARYADAFDAISPVYVKDTEPYWGCGWMSPLDLMMLYCLVASNRPSQYVEVGSGCSTTFVRRAVQDNKIPTRITSIDPAPRAGIDAICDRVIRTPLEDVDLTLFDQLSAGDVVLVDGSHRSFTNSDATVAVLDVIPRVPPGVLIGIDDIYLPDDYPPHWANRFYSEQYLLAAWLLGGAKGLEIIFPSAFALTDPELSALIGRLLAKEAFNGLSKGGNTFWMKKAA